MRRSIDASMIAETGLPGRVVTRVEGTHSGGTFSAAEPRPSLISTPPATFLPPPPPPSPPSPSYALSLSFMSRSATPTLGFSLVIAQRKSDGRFLVVKETNNRGWWLPAGIAVTSMAVSLASLEVRCCLHFICFAPMRFVRPRFFDYLECQSSFFKRRAFRGRLWIPYHRTGHVEPGESFQVAARRETLEEAGVVVLEGAIRLFGCLPSRSPHEELQECSGSSTR